MVCAAATVAAVIRKAGNIEGQTVAVVGAGMLGLTACAMTSAYGVRCVVAIEPDMNRAALAARFGATAALDGIAKRGADVVLEFSGVPDAVEAGFGLLDVGGRYGLAGAAYPAQPVQLSAVQIVRPDYSGDQCLQLSAGGSWPHT